MIKSVYNYPVSQLFDIEARVVYSIPRYQREYTWGKLQWESLFDDILESDPGYFLGSIICINQSGDSLGVQRLEVVDGQQRLTTLSLLFAAVYGALGEHRPALDDDQQVELLNLKRKLVLKKGDDEIRVIPQVQNNNQDDYRAILSKVGVIARCEALPHAGNRKIFRAFRYFQSRLAGMAEEGEPLPAIMALLEKINQASIVKIEVASHSDAYTLFESLNNRGIPLTAIDLIKNKLLARLEADAPGKVDYYFNQWNKLLDHLGDDYAVQERFFRQYYNAFKDALNAPFRKEGDKKKDPLGPVAQKSNLIQIYEKLIDQDAKTHLDHLREAGQLYALLVSPGRGGALAPLEKPLKDLERIQGAPSYLLMLYLLVRREVLGVGADELGRITRLLTCFFVRRNLTDTPPTRDLTRFFMGIIDKIAFLKGAQVVAVIGDELRRVSASDEVFRAKLGGAIYEENGAVARFVLCALAEEGMTKETWVDLWKVENRQFVWTTEHIFPQGEHIPPVWVGLIADGDVERAGALQQSHVHKLGNLTISGFNSVLSNKSFEEKRDRTDRQGRAVGYKNGLKLNADLATAETWGMAQIDARTNRLVAEVMRLFSLSDGVA